MTTRIKLRRDTAANWTANNPILAAGEPGLETDTGKTKYGDGTTAWTSLSYATGGITAREQIGYFMTYGTLPNNTNGDDLWFESVETDPDGNAYYVGGVDDSLWARVVKVDSLGELQWDKEISWADGYEGNAVSAVYSTATDRLIVAAQMWKMDTPELGAAVITINAETGAMIGNPIMIRDEVQDDGSATGGIDPTDIILDSNGNPIVVGHKYGNASVYALTTTTPGVTDSIFVDTAIFTDKTPTPYNDWYITGTNITGEAQVVDVNYYYNQPAVPVVPTAGSGAIFNITSDGAGGYTLDLVANGGTGYVVGNKIKILGTALGGADDTNDATITVSSVDTGAITAANIGGLSTGGATFNGVTGTNIVSGSNAFITVQWKVNADGQAYFPDHPSRFGASVAQYGSGFAIGDALYLNPDQYGGSTSATITVTTVDVSGAILDFAFTGTFNTSTIKLTTGGSIDFSTEGNWSAKNYSAEAFVWTPGWTKTFGDNGFDKVNAVARDSAGNIYLACESYNSTIPAPWGFGIDLPVLVKLDSTGNLLWAKKFTPDWWTGGNNDDGYTGVAVDSNDDVIVAENTIITKVDSSGTVIWQKVIGLDAPMVMFNTCVEVDSSDNVYVNGEHNYMGQTTNDDFLVAKFDSDGNVLWQREVGTSFDESNWWNNGFQTLSVVNDQVYIAGSTLQGTDDVALAVSFPADGTGADINHKGRFFIHTATWTVSTSTASVYNFTVAVNSTQVTVTTETNFTCVTTSTDIVSLALRTGDVDGRIEDLYSVSFEDGSVQTTAYTGRLDRLENFIQNTDSFYPNITHANKLMRWDADGYSNSVQIYIPHNSDVPYPVGTQLHFVKERGINAFMFWCWANVGNVNEMRIIPSSPASGLEGNVYNTDEGWSVRDPNDNKVPARATLTKTDTNTWLLECSSSVHIMDWSW